MGAFATPWFIRSGRSTLPDLAQALRVRMAAGEPAWFPGLAATLVDEFWAARPDMDRAAYTTEGWLDATSREDTRSNSMDAPLPLHPLPQPLAGRFTAAPADVHDVGEDLIHDALGHLDRSDAGSAVRALIRSVHAVASQGPGFDLSHSEPSIPFSVLISLPTGERHAGYRIAESLLHEAMHLQLTLIESRAALVCDGEGLAYSPWQDRLRPAQGLLHGLYVFRAIRDWLLDLSSSGAGSDDARAYAGRRLSEIGDEIQQVSDLPASGALTPLGQNLAAWLLAGTDER